MNVYIEDYFSVEIEGSNPAFLYEAQLMNMIEEVEFLTEADEKDSKIKAIIDKFVEFVREIIAKIKKFWTDFKTGITKKIAELKAKGNEKEEITLKIPYMETDVEKSGSTIGHVNPSDDPFYINDFINTEVEGVKRFFSAPDWDEEKFNDFFDTNRKKLSVKGSSDTNKEVTRKEFNQMVDKLIRDSDRNSEKIIKAISFFESKDWKDKSDDDYTSDDYKSMLRKATIAVNYLYNLDTVNGQWLYEFVKANTGSSKEARERISR